MLRLIARACPLALALNVLVPAAASAAPRTQAPTLTVVGSGSTASGSTAVVDVGGVATISASSLDPSRQAVLYKGRLADDPSMSGWEYLYYRGFDPGPEGTLTLDETQDRAGTYRYQVCQLGEGRRARWLCSDYAELLVA